MVYLGTTTELGELGMGHWSPSSGAQATQRPGKVTEPFPAGSDPFIERRAACPGGPPGTWMPWSCSGGESTPLTPVPFLHQGCEKSRSLNNIAGAVGTSLGLSPLASRFSSPYPPRKLLLSPPFHTLSPPPGHSAP